MSPSVAAIVLCAGKGTRMKSDQAKVLHPLLGRPLCFYPVACALEAKASPVVAVVGYQADEVASALREAFPQKSLRFATQKEQKGTAHAVRSAKAQLEGHRGPILILYGDVPLLQRETLEALVQAVKSRSTLLALVTTSLSDPSGYGRVIRSRGRIARVVEEKDCSGAQRRIKECNAGVYAVDSDFLWGALRETRSSNAQREFYLTDLVELGSRRGKVASVSAEFPETAGVNDREELAHCARVLRSRVNSRHMKAGVSLFDPDSAFIDDTVEIGGDTEIGPLVSLSAACRIGRGVRIGQGSVLANSEVGDGTEVRPYSVLENAHVGKNCIIGPFARLRPGTQLADSVHIGNFVETKKASIGKGSKANHLSYLGDAQIGAGVNVGAGTITCNYDGVNKYVTILEDNVFVGSDTQLVAPVTVRAGSYIGAGTTVTEDVPPMSLALSRSPQVIKEGWVEKKKAQGAGKAGPGKAATKAG